MLPSEWMLEARAANLNVMPLKPRDKRPLLETWSDLMWSPASMDDVKCWAQEWPDCNYAVICGMVSALVVIDCDSIAASDQVDRLAPWTYRVGTGKGTHYYARHPCDGEISNRIAARPGIDIRGDGGYVVGPGSIHPSGAVYSGFGLFGMDTIKSSPLFDRSWFPGKPRIDSSAETLRPPCMVDKELETNELLDAISKLSLATQEMLLGKWKNGPNWNHRIFVAACDLAGAGFPYCEALRFILSGAAPYTPDDRDAAIKTIYSAYSRPRATSREARKAGVA